LRLVSEAMAGLNRELRKDEHRLHRSVLVHNRARVLAALGRTEEALADFDTVIELDPNYPDYYFDRAAAHRRLGEFDQALANYDKAITLTPPFHELHYNRADLRVEMGDIDGAISDFSYVVELEPDQLDARINLISLLLDTEQQDRARTYVQEGLRLRPGDPRLLHADGLVALLCGDVELAEKNFDLALEGDPHLVVALASRAELRFTRGDHRDAVADLTRAMQVDQDVPDLIYNRGYVYEMSGQTSLAMADYERALGLPGADKEELTQRIARCREGLVSAVVGQSC
jgi:tetratricopeptide (TPR) repeat protein